jgi:hypothetical protein
MMSTLLYDSDFYRWTVEQVERLRLGKWEGLDIENLAEEIEALGSPKRSELENRLAILLGHLIKNVLILSNKFLMITFPLAFKIFKTSVAQ